MRGRHSGLAGSVYAVSVFFASFVLVSICLEAAIAGFFFDYLMVSLDQLEALGNL